MEVCGQNICYLVATFCDSNKFDMQHDHVLKKVNLDIFTLRSGVCVGGGSVGKIFATLLQRFVIPINLKCNMTMAGVSKLAFIVAKLKPLEASLACGAVINFSPIQSLDQLLLRVVLTIEGVKKWVLAILEVKFV